MACRLFDPVGLFPEQPDPGVFCFFCIDVHIGEQESFIFISPDFRQWNFHGRVADPENGKHRKENRIFICPQSHTAVVTGGPSQPHALKIPFLALERLSGRVAVCEKLPAAKQGDQFGYKDPHADKEEGE